MKIAEAIELLDEQPGLPMPGGYATITILASERDEIVGILRLALRDLGTGWPPPPPRVEINHAVVARAGGPTGRGERRRRRPRK